MTISANYLNYSDLPNGFLTKSNTSGTSQYESERNLYDVFLTEMYNQRGVTLIYYTTTFDVSASTQLFGEDDNRYFVRNFQIQGFYSLPRQDLLWSRFGVEGLDQFSVFVSKRHFAIASTYNSGQTSAIYSSIIPKIGDVINAKYNNTFYDVIDLKEETALYLQSPQHVFELIVRPYRDRHIKLSATTSATMGGISAYTDKDSDIFNLKDFVESKTPSINYNPSVTEKSSEDFWS